MIIEGRSTKDVNFITQRVGVLVLHVLGRIPISLIVTMLGFIKIPFSTDKDRTVKLDKLL